MVEYFQLKELPGKQFFRCSKLNATLQDSSCAERWKAANTKGAAEGLETCRNCQIGAKHAGAGEISLSPLRGLSICARCHQGTTRLVNKHLCVSCYNRQREYIIGRNRRGTAPINHPPLAKVSAKIQEGRALRKVSIMATGMEEVVVATLRDADKQVTFGFHVPKLMAQLELWE